MMDPERQKAFAEVVGEGVLMGYLSGSGEDFGFTKKGKDPMTWLGATVQERVEKHKLQALVEATQDQIEGLNQRIQRALAVTTSDAERIGKLKDLLEESRRKHSRGICLIEDPGCENVCTCGADEHNAKLDEAKKL